MKEVYNNYNVIIEVSEDTPTKLIDGKRHLLSEKEIQDAKKIAKEWDDNAVERKKAFVERERKAAYRADADPLFFQYQRGEIDKQIWLDKVQEIKNKFPK